VFSGALIGSNPRHFSNFALADRMYKWKNTFSDTGGTSGTDNSACWFLGDPGGQRNYIGFKSNTIDHLPTSSNGYMVIDTYQCKYVLIEGTALGTPSTAPQHLLFPKGAGCQEITVRANVASSPWGSDLINFYLGSDGSTGTPASTNQEMCWNTLVSTNTTADHSTVAVSINNAQNNSSPATVWSYRNTILGIPAIQDHAVNALTFTSDNDVIVHNATVSGLVGKWIAVNNSDGASVSRNPTSITAITYAINGVECQGNTSAGILDGSYLLTGSFRTSYLGLRGAEIA
jgi:hypothetical protein